jgi:hypothetical protein
MMRSSSSALHSKSNAHNGTLRQSVGLGTLTNGGVAIRQPGLETVPSSLAQALDAFTFQLNPETHKIERMWLSLISNGALEALSPQMLVRRYTEWKAHQAQGEADNIQHIQPFIENLNRLAFQHRHLKGAERVTALVDALQTAIPSQVAE